VISVEGRRIRVGEVSRCIYQQGLVGHEGDGIFLRGLQCALMQAMPCNIQRRVS
jgi:hypothetical protein